MNDALYDFDLVDDQIRSSKQINSFCCTSVLGLAPPRSRCAYGYSGSGDVKIVFPIHVNFSAVKSRSFVQLL